MEQTAPNESIEAIIEREKIYSQIIEESIEIIIIHADYKVLYINESGARFLGGTKEEIIGANVLDIIQEDHKEGIRQRIKKVMEENKQAELIEQTMLRLDGSPFDTEVNCKPTTFGNKPAIQSVLRDVTERREAEKKHKELLKQINDVSAPIVPALDGVYILPLVGSIDSDRAKQLLDSIPSKIQKLHVQHLIIDFSGVYNFDALVADYLLKMSTVMSLLGVRSILTGLRPELAQTVTDLGVDLSSVKKMATVQQAIKQLSLK